VVLSAQATLNREKAARRKAKAAYRLVQSWTKHIDIFKKKLLLIPINDALHW
jgi:Ulp1 family protease